MNKKNWYIWLSVFAFLALWFDTSKKLKYKREHIGLSNRATLNLMKLTFIYITILPAVIGIIVGSTVLRNVPYESILFELLNYGILFLIYLGGVYSSHNHLVWRENNMSHLL